MRETIFLVLRMHKADFVHEVRFVQDVMGVA